MEQAIKAPDKPVQLHYDSEADVLYVSFGSPRVAEGIDLGENTILRVDPDTGEIVGITIINFSKRLNG